MEFLSLIYTKRINKKCIHNMFVNDSEFCLFKKAFNEEIFINSSKSISVKLNNYKVEIMYESRNYDYVASLINKLVNFNGNRSISIKTYNNEEKYNLMKLLKRQKCYFV